MRVAVAVLVVTLGVATALVGCGGSENSAAPAAATTAASAARCLSVAPLVVSAIEEGLTVTGGGHLSAASAVRSSDFSQLFFVSAVITGPGMPDETIGTWATNRIDDYGSIFAVDALAQEFSNWGDGSTTDANMTLADDGASESRACVQDKN